MMAARSIALLYVKVFTGSFDKDVHFMRYFRCEVGLAMCHSTGSIGDTPIDPF